VSQWGCSKTIVRIFPFDYFLLDSISYVLYNIDTMKHKQKITKLRKQINSQFEKLTKLQAEMLSPKEMIAACLIKRYLGTKEQKRVSPAFYLSVFKNGRTILKHVSKRDCRISKGSSYGMEKISRGLKKMAKN